MNNKKRDSLRLAISKLNGASDLVSKILDEEQDCLDNMPENLQDSERYQRFENAISNLEEAIECIDNAKDSIVYAAN